MGIGLLAGFAAFGSWLKSLLAAIPTTVWLIIVCILVGIYVGHGGCGCRKREPKPPKQWTRAVNAVTSGATIVVNKRGENSRRTITVFLADIEAPASGPLADKSRDNLERLAGREIRVEVPRHRLFGADGKSPEWVYENYDQILGGNAVSGSMAAVAYGASNTELNLQQIKDGWATATRDAPKEYLAAEKAARKAHVGQWGKQ
ncbi:MAG: hypothetical protein LLG00_16725 [Planctomycetaceae bacterium]|nr:hypothetical protein [Planctomycetaceae bacterium]